MSRFKMRLAVVGLLVIAGFGWQGIRLYMEPTKQTQKKSGKKTPSVPTPATARNWVPAEIRRMPVAVQSKHCLALNAYYEARNEPQEGVRMVLYVTSHRAKLNRPYFGGRDFCSVVFHRTPSLRRVAGKSKVVWVPQFSWTNDTRVDLKPRNKEKWAFAQQAAQEQLDGTYVPPAHLRPALYYLNPTASSRNGKRFFRKLRHLDTIGSHQFYAEKRA